MTYLIMIFSDDIQLKTVVTFCFYCLQMIFTSAFKCNYFSLTVNNNKPPNLNVI